LDGVLGTGKSIVRVTTDLDFQQLERTSEVYDANTPSIRSEERIKSTTTVAQTNDEASESNEDGSNETTITNYELNKTIEHIVNATGNIERLSIAFMVDGTYQEVEDNEGEMTQVYQPRPQEEMDRLAAIVRNAVGFDPARNDQIEIVNLPFERQDLDNDREMLDMMYQREMYMEIGKNVGLVLLGLFVIMYFKKKSRRLFAALSTMLPPPVVRKAPTRPQGVAIEEEEIEPVVAESRKPRLVDHMQKTAHEKPDEIARVIKTMMIE